MKSKPNRNLDASARNRIFKGAQAGGYLPKGKKQSFGDAPGGRRTKSNSKNRGK